MATLFKVLGFSLTLVLVFTLVANLLPQIEGEAPVEEEINLGELTMDSFIALGEQTFSGKGTCTLCHNDLGRAPDLLVENVVENAALRMTSDGYKGTATSVEEYIKESMLDPGIYVVSGFGKKGSNDTESPMPNVQDAPILLSDVEIDAIIAFLQFKDGNDVTLSLPTEAPIVTETTAVAEPVIAATAEEALTKYSCSACHTVLGTESPIGPDLTTVGNRLDANQLRESIINPGAVVAEGFPPIMPPNIAEKMTVKELEMLVAFLVEQKAK